MFILFVIKTNFFEDRVSDYALSTKENNTEFAFDDAFGDNF